MENQFTCNMCRKRFDLKDRGFFGFSQGYLCKNCWEKILKEQEENERKHKEIEEKEFEEKVRRIVNKILKKRGIK